MADTRRMTLSDGTQVEGFFMSLPAEAKGLFAPRSQNTQWCEKRKHFIPTSEELVEWLDYNTPGWAMAFDETHPFRTMRLLFPSKEKAALFKLFFD